MKTKNLLEKAMLVDLTITQWTARKYDKNATATVEETYNTTSQAGRFRKALVAKNALRDIKSIVSAARDYHRFNTCAWLDNGARILPAANYMEYTAKMRKYKAELEKQVERLLQDYPRLVEEAKIMLGGLYNSDEYPELPVLKSKYSFKVQVTPIPSGNDFRVALNTSEIKAIQTDIEARVKEATQNAIRDLWSRLFEVVNKCVEKFSDPDAIFRESLIGNMAELVELLPKLNITDNADLNKMCSTIRNKLCNLSTEELREDPKYREKAAEEAKNIMDIMSGYM